MKNIPRILKYYIDYFFYIMKTKIGWKFTVYGKGVFLLFIFSFLFLGYIKTTVIFEISVIMIIYLLNSVLFTMFFRTKLVVKRSLPKYCTAEKMVTYTITIENRGKKRERGLFLFDNAKSPAPSLEQYISTYEFKEKSKKKYRPKWGWFIKRNKKAEFLEFQLEDIAPGEIKTIMVKFLPLQRGFIHFNGVTILKKDPFSLMRIGRFFKAENNIISLPKLYDLEIPKISAQRKYNQGGIAQVLKVGNSEEFISLRDYQVGDVIKRIHWKSFAKTQKPVVKEYNDEFFSRYGLILDTFSDNSYSEIFEEGVSTAASIISGIELGDSLIDLMFIGADSYIFTNGRGLSNQEKMLEILSAVKTCKEEQFEMLMDLLKGHVGLLSSLIIILIEIDEKRKKLLELIYLFNIPVKVILIGKNIKSIQKKIEKLEITTPIKILETGKLAGARLE